jgi:beta-glucosidase
MKTGRFISFFLIWLSILSLQLAKAQNPGFMTSITPVSYEDAGKMADEIIAKLTVEEKIKLIGGYSRFFIQAIPAKNIPYVFMTDATQGVRLDKNIKDTTILKRLKKTTAFPCPIMLASTWNPELAKKYARCVGEECRAAGADYLLGPGMNIYRISQCGRNFEYFGEDPFLASRMIEKYVVGVQSTGTAATLKHFVCNNTDFYRRRSNSIVDERALNEIYLPAFQAGIDAGAMAVMTSYNKLNGEWCGQSSYLITDILRNQLGFKWLVMTDWTSVYDGAKVIKSGQNIEMPELSAMKNAKALLDSNKVSIASINNMVKSILRTNIAMGFYDRPLQDTLQPIDYEEHEKTALEVARQGTVLLKNDGNILPIHKSPELKIVAVGKYMKELAHGGGSAYVTGYNNIVLADALFREFGTNIEFIDSVSEPEIASADLVILSTGTFDSEGSDRSFDLPDKELQTINRVLDLNEKTVVIVNSGGGINMSQWINKASAVVYAWYGGQTGSQAVAEILSGKVNPSGKLPISIERKFEDSPGFGYIPADEHLYNGKTDDQFTHKQFDVKYNEGIFVGYRWYEHKNIKPLFAFGFGLSYSSFEYDDLQVEPKNFTLIDNVQVSFTVKNTSEVEGSEISQLYIQDVESTFPRPLKELKGFKKLDLKPGESQTVTIVLSARDFSYWNPEKKQWFAEPGKFNILVGSSSDFIILKKAVSLE